MRVSPLFLIPLFILVLCIACSSHYRMMTQQTFDDIQIGTPAKTVITEVGKPYAIHTRGVGKQEYEYIERMDLGPNLILENHYYLTIVDGVVTRKRIRHEQPPAYDYIYQEDPNDLIRD
jgi:hypothetical protein